MVTTTTTITAIAMTELLDAAALYRLSAWLSPSFPVGAYTWSGGLEYAVEAGLVSDGPALEAWLAELLRHGAGFVDGCFFKAAWSAAADGDEAAMAAVIERADAFRPTAELAQESAAQGEAFLKAVIQAWPHPGYAALAASLARQKRKAAYAVVVGATAGFHGVPLGPALVAFLHALGANLVSAGVRLIPLGQTDGQRAIAALGPVVAETAEAVRNVEIEEIGAATPVIDWTSMCHETQYTRLFRS